MEQIVPTDKIMKLIENLYFIRWSRHPDWFIHNVDGMPILLKGFEGAAYFNEKNTEKVLKGHKGLMAIKVIDLAKEIPVVLSNFPAGHPLYGCQVCVRDFTITRN